MTHRDIAILLAMLAILAPAASAQQSGITRTDLLDRDLDVPGRIVAQVRVGFAAGAQAARHKHPGAEVAYVLEGTLEYRLDGREPITLRAGESLFIPAGIVHSAQNVGAGEAEELATYVVEKGKPLVLPP